MKKIAIIGSGSWGVALAVHLAKLGNEIKIWAYLEEERDLINNERKCKYLKDITIPENIKCSTSLYLFLSVKAILIEYFLHLRNVFVTFEPDSHKRTNLLRELRMD